ncbi:hypothetical protein BHM03_00016404, partial [Ensete ventricosum]
KPLQSQSTTSADQGRQSGAKEGRGQRSDSISGQTGSELGRTLLNRKHGPRGDLYIGHDGRKAIAENMAHIKSTKILCVARQRLNKKLFPLIGNQLQVLT